MHVARVPMTAGAAADENRRQVSGVCTAARVAHVPIARGSSRRTFGGGYACPGGVYCAEVGVAEIANSASRSAAKKKGADWAAAFSTVLHVRCNSSSKDDLTAARPVSPANAKAPESGPRTRVRSSIVFPTLDLHEIS